MPPSITEHVDIMWFIIVGPLNPLGAMGTVVIAILSFSTRRELTHAADAQMVLKAGQIIILDKLDKSIVRLHDKIDTVKKEVDEKIDTVKATVDELKGEHNVYHRIGAKNGVLQEKAGKI